MTLTKAQRKKLWAEHTMVRAGAGISASFVCKHDRLLWPCPTVKVLYKIQDQERRADYAKAKNTGA